MRKRSRIAELDSNFVTRHNGIVGCWQAIDRSQSRDLAGITRCIAKPGLIEEADVFKHNSRRTIFLYRGRRSTVVAKVFRRHYPRIGFDMTQDTQAREATNLLAAANRGLDVPQVLAIGVLSREKVVEGVVLCTKYLEERSPLAMHWKQQRDPDSRTTLLMRTLPIFEAHYRTGCVHLDLNHKNILIANPGAKHDVSIDYENACFLREPSEQSIALMAGVMLNALCKRDKPLIERSHVYEWFDALMNRLDINRRKYMWETFEWSGNNRNALGNLRTNTNGVKHGLQNLASVPSDWAPR